MYELFLWINRHTRRDPFVQSSLGRWQAIFVGLCYRAQSRIHSRVIMARQRLGLLRPLVVPPPPRPVILPRVPTNAEAADHLDGLCPQEFTVSHFNCPWC